MLQAPLSEDAPQPYDTVFLRPHNTAGVDPAAPLTVADTPDDAPGTYELHHQESHPGYWDWAAGVTIADIATVVRIEHGAARIWSPAP